MVQYCSNQVFCTYHEETWTRYIRSTSICIHGHASNETSTTRALRETKGSWSKMLLDQHTNFINSSQATLNPFFGTWMPAASKCSAIVADLKNGCWRDILGVYSICEKNGNGTELVLSSTYASHREEWDSGGNGHQAVDAGDHGVTQCHAWRTEFDMSYSVANKPCSCLQNLNISAVHLGVAHPLSPVLFGQCRWSFLWLQVTRAAHDSSFLQFMQV
jgi:hypothetical protein